MVVDKIFNLLPLLICYLNSVRDVCFFNERRLACPCYNMNFNSLFKKKITVMSDSQPLKYRTISEYKKNISPVRPVRNFVLIYSKMPVIFFIYVCHGQHL
jgi:hypothetical protein